MKVMKKNTVSLRGKALSKGKYLCFLASLLFLLLSCSDVSEEKTSFLSSAKKACTVTGSLSLGSALPSSLASVVSPVSAADSRAATSSFSSEADYRVFAYHLVETEAVSVDTGAVSTVYVREDEDNPISGSVDKESMTWSVALDKSGSWEIEITLWQNLDEDAESSVYVMSGSGRLSLGEVSYNQTVEADCPPIILYPYSNESVSGNISLTIKNESEIVKSLYYFWTGPESGIYQGVQTGNLTFDEENSLTLNFQAVPQGSYDFGLYFKDAEGETVYCCSEAIPVFSGFTTDTWYGNAPYLRGLENESGNSVTNFVVTDELFSQYDTPKTLSADTYPIVIYDRDSKLKQTEFENPDPGFAVFSEVSEGSSVSDGLVLAKNGITVDFTIDPVSQVVYTVENNNSYQAVNLVSYSPDSTYAGYGGGKVIYKSDSDNTIESLAAYDGDIFMLSDGIKYYSTTEEKCYPCQVVDENGEDLQLSFSSDVMKIALSKDYIYIATKESGYDINNDYVYYIQVGKYAITEDESGRILTRVASLDINYSDDLGIQDDCDFVSLSDMITDNDGTNLYILIAYNCNAYDSGTYTYNIQSRGGVIKVKSSQETVAGTVEGADIVSHTLSLDEFSITSGGSTSTTKVLGWYYGGYTPAGDAELENQYFYGARRFLARKPDEFVISDEGGYKIDSEKFKQKNRVVKVNLENFAMTPVDVNAGFDIYGAACGFSSYGNGSGY
ncbi:MAG: hypothetical protein IJ257_05350 [Treponema sp.]|nr:hypothetical protein [Treponema sp.]